MKQTTPLVLSGPVETRSGRANGRGCDLGTHETDFAALIAPHARLLARTAAALVGTGDAEDAVQEALTRAWQAWDKLRDPVALRGWLLRITVNVCRNWEAGRFGTRRRLNLTFERKHGTQRSLCASGGGAVSGASTRA